MFIINDTLGTYGGSITLIERLCVYATGQKEPIKIYCNDTSNKEIVGKLKKLGIEIHCFDTCNHRLLEKHLKRDLQQGEIQVINFITNQYLSVEKVKYRNKLDFVNIIYSIHPATFYKGTGIGNSILKNRVIKRYRKTIQKMNTNGFVVFMDQDNIDKTETYYSMRFEKTPHIQALPMICHPMDKNALEEKLDESYGGRIIVSACRADFPYKGYLFGLIDDFVKLSQTYENLSLVIVCSGDPEDVERVRTKIAEVPEKYRGSIHFHHWMEYQELLKLIATAYLYVGMGTGVLDSALAYVPSIAVKYDTYDNLADCMFYEKPGYVVADEHCTAGAIHVMEKALHFSRREYGQVAVKCFEEAKRLYDMDSFFYYIKTLGKRPSYLSPMDVMIHTANTFINSRKHEKGYDVNHIKYEKGDDDS